MSAEKILLVTGASSDVGSALIRKTASSYGHIWAHYCSSPEVTERLAGEIGDRIKPVRADFSDPDSVKEMTALIEESGLIPDHIVHFSALKAFNKNFHKGSWSDFQNGIDTSLRSVYMILNAFIPYMRKKRYGKIVFMLTSCVLGMPPKYQSSYVTVKYALLGLMKSIAAEYADRGITSNAVSPDMIETRFLSDVPELIIKQNAEKNPTGRNLCVDDVLPAFEYLLSDKADMVSGQNIGITAGMR